MAGEPSNANAPSALGAIPPPVTADRKKIVDDRVRTAADVVAAFSVMRTADLERSRQRALCQSAVDGAAPYSDARSRAQGSYGRSNFNPGLAQRSTFKEQAPYNAILEENDIYTSLPLKSSYSDADQRAYLEPILAEEFSAMLRKWPEFNFNWQYNVSLFVRDGVSIACFEDESDWRYNIYGLQHFKFPNGSKPCEERLDMCGWEGTVNCRDLYKKIQNEKIAAKVGWNVSAVKDAIKNSSSVKGISTADYERMEKRWKANEVLDGASPPQIETVHLLVKEVDGTVTHLCANKSGEGPVLYERRNMFKDMSRFMTIFAYGIGTNGDLHSIRGHTARIFNTVSAATRTLNSFVDMASFVATPHLECANDDAMTSIPYRKAGPMMLVGQGNKFMDVKVPDFSENLVPLYGMMTNLFEGESSGASMMPTPQKSMERKTNRQEFNERLSEGQLTTSAISLFFPAQERLFRGVARRVFRRKYRANEPGGEYVWWLRNRLKARNVPMDALDEIDFDAMEVNTGIGKGSQIARMEIADSIMEDYNLLDDQGKNEALRLKISTRAGSRIANRIVPPIPGQRPGQQVDNADDQNGFLASRNPQQIMSVKVRPDQNSAAHVRTHLEFLGELWPMTEEQDQRLALDTIQPVWAHAVEDLQLVDPKNPLFPDAKQQLREMSEWVLNTAKELAAEEDRAADEAGRGEGEGKDVGGEGPNMSNFARAIDAKAKLQFTLAKNEEELRHRRDMNALERAGKVQTMNLKNAEFKMKALNSLP